MATLAPVDWVDLLLIGLMLLAAVHGLRLGALVQLLTFGGFWLGMVVGTLLWVPALSFIHHEYPRGTITVAVAECAQRLGADLMEVGDFVGAETAGKIEDAPRRLLPGAVGHGMAGLDDLDPVTGRGMAVPGDD